MGSILPPAAAGHRLCSTLVLVLTTAAGAGAQTETFTGRLEVELVEVDVVVTDRQGEPVLDLVQEDFRLFEDGEPVEITHFSEPGSPPRASRLREANAQPAGGQRRQETSATAPRFVIFLDELHLKLSSRHRVLVRLAEVLGQRLPKGVEVMVVVFDGGVRVIQPFSGDRKATIRALTRSLGSAARAVMEGVEEERVLQLLRETLRVNLDPPPPVPIPDIMDTVCQGDLGPLARSYAAQMYSRVQGVTAALRQFLASLAPYSGQKSLLYVSDGLPMVAGQRAFEYAIELCDGTALSFGTETENSPAARYPPARAFPSAARLDLNSYNTHAAWTRVAAEANTHRVTLNTLHAAGLVPPGASQVDGPRTTLMTETSATLNDQETLVTMAVETGGKALLNANDVRPGVAKLLRAESGRYVLGFEPTDPGEGRVHRLEVQVERPKVRVRHRKSYKSKSPEEKVVGGVLASLFHGFEDNPLKVEVRANSVTGSGRGREGKIVVDVQVPLRSLVLLPENDGDSSGLFTVFVSALDDRGNGTGVKRRAHPVRVAAGDERKHFDYQVSMTLPRDREYRLAVAVRDDLSGGVSHLATDLRLE